MTWGELIQKSSRLIVLVIMMVLLTILSPEFFTVSNLINVLRQATPIFILAIGQTIVLLTGNIDLSMGSCGAISGVVMAVLVQGGQNPILAMLVGLATGALFGLINGLIITKINLPSFVTTFGTYLFGKGLVVLYLGGKVLSGYPKSVRVLATGRIGEVPVLVIIGLVVLLIFDFVLRYTHLGAKIYNVGANPKASRVSGINSKRTIVVSYVICGIMAAFACILYIARINSCKSDIGEDFQMDAISAALIGGTSFSGGVGSAGGTMLGALIVILMRNAMNLIGISSLWQGFATGLIMVLFMLFDEVLKRIIDK